MSRAAPAPLLLDGNDAEITLTRDGQTLYREPGVAFVDRREIAFGRAALARSRLHPRQTHNEFWQRLNADPVTPAGRGAANQADLVYLHLQAIRAAAKLPKRVPVVLAASAAATREQLAVLLGIAAEAGFDVLSIVDPAVAAASAQPLAGASCVVDVAQHRGVATRLEVHADEVRRDAVDDVAGAGLNALLEGWVDVVADRFVESTRFDPLRIAHTEQQVFDQVAAGVEEDAAELLIEVRHDDVARQVRVPRSALAEKSAQRYGLLARALGAPTTLALTHRARRLPGLAAFLQTAGHEVAALPANALAKAAEAHAERLVSAQAGQGARLIAALPRQGASAAPAAATAPTHLVCAGIALPLGAETHARDHPACPGGAPLFRILLGERGATVAPAPDAPVALNGARIDFAQPVAAGDRVTSGELAFLLVAVLA